MSLSPEREAAVLTQILQSRAAPASTGEASVGIWVPATVVKSSTPLDVVRSVMANHPWPAEWDTLLRELSPRSDVHSWLMGGWLDIAKRWVIYECLPYPLIPESKRVQLLGAPYWEMSKHLRAGRKQAVSAFQWEMYRLHKVWARPFFVIQGTDGGTPAKYSELEEAILQAQGKDTDPPCAGDLPYAPFDGRTVAAIRSRDRLWKMQQRVDILRASGNTDAQKAETVLAEEMFRKEFWAWWCDTMQPQAEYMAWFSAREEAQHVMRQQTDNEARAAEAAEETYLTHGHLPLVLPNGELV